MHQEIAVLTGDIVGSTALAPERLTRLFEALDGAVAEMRTWPDAPNLLAWARYRGDGWQLVTGRPGWALRACLFVRASIRAAGQDFDTRIGVGIGAADDLDSESIGTSTGPAFERSGRCLDGLGRHVRFGIDAGQDGKAGNLMQAVFGMADALSGGWTVRQAEILTYLLQPDAPSQQTVGAKLSPPIGQSVVSEHFVAAQGPALTDAVARFEAGW